MSPPTGLSYETRPAMSATTSSSGARIVAPFNQKLLPRDHFYRAAWTHIKQNATREGLLDLACDMYRGDEVTLLLLRGTSVPAQTNVQSWASELATTSVLDMLLGIGAAAASPQLIPLAANVEFPPGASQVTVPTLIVAAADAGAFVAEGGPIPVRKLSTNNLPILNMRKLAVINHFTREVYERTKIPSLVPQVINEAIGLLLDSKIFGNQADDGVTPAGLLNGISTEGATTGGGAAAVAGDVTKLIKKLSDNGGGRNVVFIAAPQQAAALKAWAGPKFDYTILASNALADKTVVAVEASSFVIAVSPEPEFSTSRQGVLHEEDTTPLQIGVGGVVASPVRSLWQTDCVALKTVLRVNWGMRATGHVSFISSVTW
jgi:hypothetical protein